jgi:adenylate cyclase
MLPLVPPQAKLVQRFVEGLQAYRARQWGKVLTLFQVALQEMPNDQPSQLYIQCCQEFQVTPPRDDWDGVYTIQTK